MSRIEYGDLMEKVGVDIVLSTRLLSASEVLAFARRGGVVSVSLLEGAKAEAVEVIVQDVAPVGRQALMDVRLPKECLVCAYVRDGEAISRTASPSSWPATGSSSSSRRNIPRRS